MSMLIVLNIIYLNQSYKNEKPKRIKYNNPTCYFYNDIINLKDFHSNLLKADEKQYKEIDIYYIGYITIKKMVIVKILYVLIHYS